MGENLPINQLNPFDPINDSETSNDEYRRLIFNSIKNLYYQNYTSGSLTGRFFHSSSFFNYEQSTLTSGSMLSAYRNIPTITGSSALGIRPTVFDTNLYDISSSIYDTTGYDPDKGSKITVISIDQNIFGSGLYPNTISISGSTYNIQDDGEGNLIDTNTSTYVGNVFYSQGLIVITNQFYLCVLGAPPISVNDYYSYSNTNVLQTLEILSNDFADCGAIDPTSVEIYGDNFPDYTINNGIITITPNQTSLVPGDYQLLYTVGNYDGIRSNTSSINLKVTSLPLEITNIVIDNLCYGATGSLEVSFDVNYGVPYYSYSLDGGASYTGSNDLFNTTFTGFISASSNNVIYVKDSTETIYSASFSSWYKPVSYTTSIVKNPCSPTSNDGEILVEAGETGTAVQARISGSGSSFYVNLPRTFTGLPTGSITIQARDINECITSSVVILESSIGLTASVTQSNVSCYSGIDGFLSIAFTNVTNTSLVVNLLDPNFNSIYNNEPLNSFPNNTVTASNLTTGSYQLDVVPSIPAECQSYSNNFTITTTPPLTFTVTASYINSCSNAILFNATGGTPPYRYFASNATVGTTYESDTNLIELNNLKDGGYSAFVVDSKACGSSTSAVKVYGRKYVLTGSFCVTASGINTGYVSSSGIRQEWDYNPPSPLSGVVVTSSYSNAAGNIFFGPTVNFTQNFISGTIDSITPCLSGKTYSRYTQNLTLCPIPPINGCLPPIITSVTPLDCDPELWNNEYAITYNSASANATYTIIEYGPSEDFTGFGSVTHIYTNSNPIILPLNYTTDSGGNGNEPNDLIYFRAYNSCSNGATSSYSDVITTQCDIPQIPEFYNDARIVIVNNTSVTMNVTLPAMQYYQFSQYDIPPNSSSPPYLFASGFFEENYFGNVIFNGPNYRRVLIGFRFRPTDYNNRDRNNNLIYKATITSANDIDNDVYTNLSAVFEYNLYPEVTFVNGYATGNNTFIYADDYLGGNQDENPELVIDIDRTYYGESFTITCSIDYVT